MLRWALLFFVVAITAGLLGFTGIAAAATEIARLLFLIFLVIFGVLLIAELLGRGRPPTA